MTTVSTRPCLVLTSRRGDDPTLSAWLAESLRQAGIEAQRVEDVIIPGAVGPSIRQAIQRAPVIVVDITDKDPEVMYYVGLAHAWRKPVYFVAQRDLKRIPQALAGEFVYTYELGNPEDLASQVSSLTERIRQWL